MLFGESSIGLVAPIIWKLLKLRMAGTLDFWWNFDLMILSWRGSMEIPNYSFKPLLY